MPRPPVWSGYPIEASVPGGGEPHGCGSERETASPARSASTQNQAMADVLSLYEHVLGKMCDLSRPAGSTHLERRRDAPGGRSPLHR